MIENAEQHRNPDRYIRCPKCKGKLLEFFEHTQTTNIFLQNEDYLLTKEEGKSGAQHTHVNARCTKCQHHWRVRGVKSLDYFRYTKKLEKEQ